MNFLALIPLRAWLYAAAALAIGALLWREHHVVHQRNAAIAQTRELTKQLNAAQETARRQEAASNAYHDEQDRLDKDRADIPVRAVRLCHGAPARVPEAASGVAAAGSGGLSEAAGSDPGDRWSDDGPDIGPALYAEADEADKCAVQRDALIRWAEGR